MITPNAFGTRWVWTIHHESPPAVLAACTYSRLPSEMTSPLTRRAVPSQDSDNSKKWSTSHAHPTRDLAGSRVLIPRDFPHKAKRHTTDRIRLAPREEMP